MLKLCPLSHYRIFSLVRTLNFSLFFLVARDQYTTTSGATCTPALDIRRTWFSMDYNIPLDGHPSMYGTLPWLHHFSDQMGSGSALPLTTVPDMINVKFFTVLHNLI